MLKNCRLSMKGSKKPSLSILSGARVISSCLRYNSKPYSVLCDYYIGTSIYKRYLDIQQLSSPKENQ
jgi:hypothetical protein